MVLWKPAGSAILSNYVFYRILREAGVPPGVINFVPSEGSVFGRVITRSPHFAGLNFTGSTRRAPLPLPFDCTCSLRAFHQLESLFYGSSMI